MMTFYAAAGSYQIRSEDGKNMPYIMRLGKLQPVSIPEFSLWSMLLWDVLTYEELHKKFYDKMEETEIEPSSFDKSLEMLVKRKLIIKGVGLALIALRFLEGFLQKRCGVTVQDRLSIDLLGQKND